MKAKKSSDSQPSKNRRPKQKTTSFDINHKKKPSRIISEAPSQAEDSMSSAKGLRLVDSEEDIAKLYPHTVAKKYHFVEVYLDKVKKDETVAMLYEQTKRKNSLKKLLSFNVDELEFKKLAKAKEAKRLLLQQEKAAKEMNTTFNSMLSRKSGG